MNSIINNFDFKGIYKYFYITSKFEQAPLLYSHPIAISFMCLLVGEL